MEPIKKVIKQSSVQIDRERETFANTLGITGVQMTTLDFISNHQNQTVSQHEIEKELDLKRSTVTIMIQRMEKRDLVKRVTNAVSMRIGTELFALIVCNTASPVFLGSIISRITRSMLLHSKSCNASSPS